MKKIISTFLAVIMLVSCIAVSGITAFASNKNTQSTAIPLAYNTPVSTTFRMDYTGNNDLYETVEWFSFTPSTTMYYQVNVSNFYQDPTKDYGQTSLYIYNSTGDSIASGGTDLFYHDCMVAAELNAGQTYYIELDCYGYDGGVDYFKVPVSWTLTLTINEHIHDFNVTEYTYFTAYDCKRCKCYFDVDKVCSHTSGAYVSGAVASTYFSTGYSGNNICNNCGAVLGYGTTVAKKKATISSIKSAKKKLTVKWKKVSGANGYQVKYSLKKNMKSSKTTTIKKGSTTSKSISKLKSKKKYYVQVRAYKNVNGKKVYSSWSNVKSTKTK